MLPAVEIYHAADGNLNEREEKTFIEHIAHPLIRHMKGKMEDKNFCFLKKVEFKFDWKIFEIGGTWRGFMDFLHLEV